MIDVEKAIDLLKKAYPDAKCSLDYGTPFQLLVSVILAAQCKDDTVNKVTPELFRRFPDAESMAKASVSEVEECIKLCGLFRSKAKNIIECSKELVDKYNGEVPGTMEELTLLAGVGRKTANLILGDIFGQPSYVVDTHCKRIVKRMGMTKETDPAKVEKDLRKLIPPAESGEFCHRMVIHGRAVCSAPKPKCEQCILSEICPKYL